MLQPTLNPVLTTIPIARNLPHIYSECSGIWNPIHTDIHAARRAGLDDIILHGTCSWALAGNQIVERYCDGDPTRLRRLAARFQGRVIPGTSVNLTTWFDGTAAGYGMTNHMGEPAQRSGFAAVTGKSSDQTR
jgi:acyl dehydratase